MATLSPTAASLPTRGAAASAANRVDIIGIGVQKAATTWIFRCLAEHPEIRTATLDGPNKELNFFNHEYERGYAWYHRGFAFGPWKTLEFSTLYFHDRNVPPRLARYNPRARLLLALRNPIDRAFSHHKHEIRRKRLPRELYDFWAALEQNPAYVEQGLYATHLTRWLEHFPREQIHIVFYEDICARPAEVFRGILEFIGVDPTFLPGRLGERVNATVFRRNEELERLMRRSSRIIRRRLGETWVAAVKATGVPALVRAYSRKPVPEPEIPPPTEEDRARLARFFEDENARLARLLGRGFAHWR